MPALSTNMPGESSSRSSPSPSKTDKRLVESVDDNDRLLPIELQEHKTLCDKTKDPPTFAHFTITRREYRELRKKIEQTFKRFDYEPARNRLTIRMPSPTHSYAAQFFQQEILTELDNVLKNCTDETKLIADTILTAQGCRVYLTETDDDFGPIERAPDLHFTYEDTRYPSIMAEVAYSQDGKKLRSLAQDYILSSNGRVKLVIGFDLSYRNEPSTVSLWRRKVTETEEGPELAISEEVKQVPFCSSNGQVLNSDQSLVINLRDFAPDHVSKKWPDVALNIAFSRLAQLFQKAQRLHRKVECDASVDEAEPRQWKLKRKLSSSPVQPLSSNDEASDRTYKGPAAKRRCQSSSTMLLRSAKKKKGQRK